MLSRFKKSRQHFGSGTASVELNKVGLVPASRTSWQPAQRDLLQMAIRASDDSLSFFTVHSAGPGILQLQWHPVMKPINGMRSTESRWLIYLSIGLGALLFYVACVLEPRQLVLKSGKIHIILESRHGLDRLLLPER